MRVLAVEAMVMQVLAMAWVSPVVERKPTCYCLTVHLLQPHCSSCKHPTNAKGYGWHPLPLGTGTPC